MLKICLDADYVVASAVADVFAVIFDFDYDFVFVFGLYLQLYLYLDIV